MSITYNVTNNHCLEPMTTEEEKLFERQKPGLVSHPGKVCGFEATCFRNSHRELVYVTVESWNRLEGYELQG